MSKTKRTYNAEFATSADLQLLQTTSKTDEHSQKSGLIVPKKQIFTPELIARLTERIKKI